MYSRMNKSALACLLVALSVPGFCQSDDPDNFRKYTEKGQIALSRGDYVEAEKAFEALTKLSPDVAEIYANLGLVYFKERKFELAVEALQKALKLKPTVTKSELLLAMSLAELGRHEEALPTLEKEYRRSTDPVIKRSCGLQPERAYTTLRQDSKAVQVALELNKLYPDDPEVLYHSSRIFGNYAYLSIKRLADVAPTSIWKHQAAAEAWESQGSFDLALNEYQQVLTMDPRRPGIHYRCGRVLLARSRTSGSQDDLSAALKEFASELEIDSTNANAAYEIAEAHRSAGDAAEAEKFFISALKYYPDFEQANLGLAAVLLEENHPEQAASLLRRAIDVNPENEVAWYRLAQVERALGNESEHKKAFAEFEKLRKRSAELEATIGMFSPSEVTKQTVDSPVAKP